MTLKEGAKRAVATFPQAGDLVSERDREKEMERGIGRLLALGSVLVNLAGAALGADHSSAGFRQQLKTARGRGWPAHHHLSIGDILAGVRFAGMRPLTAPALNGSLYFFDVVKDDGAVARVTVDATTGNVVKPELRSRPPLPSPRSVRRLAQFRPAAQSRRRTIQLPHSLADLVEANNVVQQAELPIEQIAFASVPSWVFMSANVHLNVGSSVIEWPQKGPPTSIVLFATDADSERSGYVALTIEPSEVPATDRRHELFATCIATEPQNRIGFAFLTNLPDRADHFKNGDRLDITALPCVHRTDAPDARITISLKKTADIRTKMPLPRAQYVMMGDLLGEPAGAKIWDRVEEIVQDCAFCPQMLTLPRGSMMMGNNQRASEQPVHRVAIAPFALSRYPVSVREWRRCIAASACSEAPIRRGDNDDIPVHNVSFEDAQKYVAWLTSTTMKTYRLPSEAEFEYAARAGTKTEYWWGDHLLDGMANCRQCGEPFNADSPSEASKFMPNGFGLYGVSGGVAQWVADCWHDTYGNAPEDGSPWNTPECAEHVLRSGSWLEDPAQLRAASRSHSAQRQIGYGLRVARNL
jgi:formylglycine-generating enzyme required for sulfatase activity